MAPSAPSHRQARAAARQRDEGLLRVRRLTQGAAIAAVGGVAVMAGYVAHAVPGHHVSSPSTPGAATQPADNSPAPSSGLAPPASPPQTSYQAPQVVSGSS